MIYIRTELRMSSSSGSLVVTIKLKTKYIIHTFVMVLFCILQKIALAKFSCFFPNLLSYIISILKIRCRWCPNSWAHHVVITDCRKL